MIREARIEDHKQIEKIMSQVHQMHVNWRPDVYREVEEVLPIEYFSELVRNHEVICYVEQDLITGICFFKEKNVSGAVVVSKKTLFVDTMAVLDGYRGQGVGHALFEKLKQIAKEKNCEGIELQVNAKNEKAMKMYKDYGFTEKSINMEIVFYSKDSN